MSPSKRKKRNLRKRKREGREHIYICELIFNCNIGDDRRCAFKDNFAWQKRKYRKWECHPPNIVCSPSGWDLNIPPWCDMEPYKPVKLIKTGMMCKDIQGAPR